MSDLTGQTLGRYQLVGRLGRGGMADVYKGFQPGLDRYVAVKVLHPHLSEEPGFITRFQREAKAVAMLRHPNIVQVFDFDVQGESHYMVMEYVEGGQSLKELLQGMAARGERLPLETALDIAAKLSDALSYAHRQGMVHRDLKPANVLMPSLAQPILSDFGIARIIGQSNLTASGAMIGTPAYMSPEQGRGEQADERSDIYAMGIIIYEMLTGRPPYDADTPYGVILKHINDPITPPHVLIEGLPKSVERVVLRCLAKDPNDRFQSASDLHDALQNAAAHLADETRPAMATTPMGGVAEDEELSPDTLPLSLQAADETDAAGTRIEDDSWAPVSGDNAAVTQIEMDDSGPPVPPTMVAASAREQAPRARSRLPLIVGGVVLVVLIVAALGAWRLGLFSGAAAPVETPAVIQPTVQSAPADQSAQTANAEMLVRLAFEKLVAGDQDSAREYYNQALVANYDNVEARAGRALLYTWNGDYSTAKHLLAGLDDPSDNPLVNLSEGRVHAFSGDNDDPGHAVNNFTRTIETCGDRSVLCVWALVDRSQVRLWSLGDPQGALDDIDQAISRNTIRDDLPNLYDRRADIQANGLNAIADAQQSYEQAYEASGHEPSYLKSAAALALRIDDMGGAAGYFERLLAEHPADPNLMAGQAYIAWKSGDPGGAMDELQRALQFDPANPKALYTLGLIQLDMGNPRDAVGQFTPVLVLPETWPYDFPFLSPQFGHEINYDTARADFALGDLDYALELIQQSLDRMGEWGPQPFILRGQILEARGDLAGARDNYLHAQDLTGDQFYLDQINTLLSQLGS